MIFLRMGFGHPDMITGKRIQKLRAAPVDFMRRPSFLPTAVAPAPPSNARPPEGSARVECFVAEHLDSVWRTVRRLGVPSRDVEDVVQEVIMVFFRRASDIGPGKERAFAVATAVRVAANWHRTRRRKPQVLVEGQHWERVSHQEPPLRYDPERMVQHRRGLALLQQVLDEMTEVQRAAFVLFELEQMSAKRIAEQLEVPETTIVSRLGRARAVFRAFCERCRARQGVAAEEEDRVARRV